MKYILYMGGLLLFFTACNKAPKEPITAIVDYNSYLTTESRPAFESAMEQKDFWSARLRPDSSGVGDLAPLAGAYTSLFQTTGDANYLDHAVTLYTKGHDLAGSNKDSYARALAHTYISKHRFKEAKDVLEESYAGISNKHQTELMLFDVYMEVGEYVKADKMLGKIKNPKDYHYLIRLSKWMDYKGNLDAAISYMEQAKDIAESRNTKSLKVWTYSNLGDYYGHAGRIKDAYEHYLMTLALEPDNAYVKKGIAWIAYAAEGNTDEANRILDSVMKNHNVPDYHLLKSELAAYSGNASEAEMQQHLFLKAVDSGNYGDMYNAYLIEHYAEENPQKALALAMAEVQNRATPETFHLLALAQLKNGNEKEALETIETYVEGKTFEPMAQLHSAMVYKANGLAKKVVPLKEDLLTAAFELGPVTIQEVEKL